MKTQKKTRLQKIRKMLNQKSFEFFFQFNTRKFPFFSVSSKKFSKPKKIKKKISKFFKFSKNKKIQKKCF